MRRISCLLLFLLITLGGGRAAHAVPFTVSWLTHYGNESIETAHLSEQPRMLHNISNSLMTAAPSFLDGSIYLQRRSEFTTNYTELNGIGETSEEWLRSNRVTISTSAVVITAVREDTNPGAGALLTSLGWTPLDQTITLAYYSGTAHLDLYAGLVNAGQVDLQGAGVNDLRIGTLPSSIYYFFQSPSVFSPELLSEFKLVPEPGTLVLAATGVLLFAAARRRR
ncbi:MAG TPA: PEP-CTERM sorting domain-containing protein [Pirellulales bacterium]|jgi:hypothetical protein